MTSGNALKWNVTQYFKFLFLFLPCSEFPDGGALVVQPRSRIQVTVPLFFSLPKKSFFLFWSAVLQDFHSSTVIRSCNPGRVPPKLFKSFKRKSIDKTSSLKTTTLSLSLYFFPVRRSRLSGPSYTQLNESPPGLGQSQGIHTGTMKIHKKLFSWGSWGLTPFRIES